MTRIAFVTASRGNYFMTELLAAVSREVADAGGDVVMAYDEFPSLEQTDAYVVIPHEYFACAPPTGHPSASQLRRTIAFCVEQPGTKWFELSHRHARRAGAAMDIERSAAVESRRRGLGVEDFQLGYSAYWDSWHRDETQQRPVDVLFLGSHTDRRAQLIASFGEHLWDTRARFVIAPESPKTGASRDFLIEEVKRAQLRAAKLILNLHRQSSPYFEWCRALEAICNGCVVVSEHSSDCRPLIPGEHFVSARPASLGLLARGLVDDADRLATLRLDAYDFVRSELPMRSSAARLLAIAAGLGSRHRRPPGIGGFARLPALGHAVREQARTLAASSAVKTASKAKELMLQDPELGHVFRAASELDFQLGKVRAAIKHVALDQLKVQRAIERDGRAHQGVDVDRLIEVTRTPAYARADPRVSIVVPLHNYPVEVVEALESAAAAAHDSFEVIVLDDASTDSSRAVVERFFDSMPGLPGRLVAQPFNQGLGKARNVLARLARGELVFFLDADNAIYPTALTRLAEALEADPAAVFAYGMIEVRTAGQPTGLVSFREWEPARLRDGNYIDAMALFRRRDLIELGGFDEDIRMTGWEDYDLWCRCASRGLHGVLVPQVLGRYRRSGHSMLALTGIDHQVAWSMLVHRHPEVLGGAPIPWHMRSLHPGGAG
ncbi:MAG: hypothetical protein QOH12_3501 [Solirubrobacteraceae bacterium]|jgi:hypothetical protein|nr:hypothetical protein [Solirubrobacteraceae bacterium]